MSGSGDSVEQIDVELAELRALVERIDRGELEAGDRLLLRAIVSDCLAEQLAEEGEIASEDASEAVCVQGSTSECESNGGAFGVLLRKTRR